MEITTIPALLTQPTRSRPGQRAGRSCTLPADRSAVQPFAIALPPVSTRPGRSWAHVARTEGQPALGMFDVRSTTLSADGHGYAVFADVKGDRLGLPAWSPPV